jgi:hypothetical protein
MSKATVAEKRDVERDYGFSGVEAIIDHPEHGRLLICDGFGGMDDLKGGAVRFEHGLVVKLHDEDTFDALDADWNEATSVMTAVTHGYDDTRPVLEWTGYMVDELAKACGL